MSGKVNKTFILGLMLTTIICKKRCVLNMKEMSQLTKNIYSNSLGVPLIMWPLPPGQCHEEDDQELNQVTMVQ